MLNQLTDRCMHSEDGECPRDADARHQPRKNRPGEDEHVDHRVEPRDLRPRGRIWAVDDAQLHGYGNTESHAPQTVWLADNRADSRAGALLGSLVYTTGVVLCEPAAAWTAAATTLATSEWKTLGMM